MLNKTSYLSIDFSSNLTFEIKLFPNSEEFGVTKENLEDFIKQGKILISPYFDSNNPLKQNKLHYLAENNMTHLVGFAELIDQNEEKFFYETAKIKNNTMKLRL